MKVLCPVPLGELVDKISILRIKQKMITDKAKLGYVGEELSGLEERLEELKLENIDSFLQELIEVNEKLWNIEDQIREKEREGDFGEEFVQLARSVYLTNDKRFEIKNRINQNFGSEVREVKSYEEY